MSPRPQLAVLAFATAALLAGCGSSAKSVTVASLPGTSTTTATQPAAAETTTTTATSAPTTTTAPQTTTAGGTSAPSPERTSSAPAFTEQETHAEGVSGAVATVRSLGYTPVSEADYHPNQTLRVLVGTQSASTSGYGQRAFFFVGDHYIGTDTKIPSAKISIVSQGEASVTIAYPIYHRGNSLCCPAGGQANVTFQLDNGKLQAMQPIPPASPTAPSSRL